MATAEEQLIEKGIEKGRVSTLRDVLVRLLVSRFGPLDLDANERIAAASPELLDLWVERVVSVQSVDEVFSR